MQRPVHTCLTRLVPKSALLKNGDKGFFGKHFNLFDRVSAMK
jgi:hypothetical protein